MTKSKYSGLLTVILVVAIISVLAIVTVLIVNAYSNYKKNREASNAISQFENSLREEDNENNDEDLVMHNIVEGASSSGKSGRKVKYYNNFVMLGYIEIPKIKIRYPILEEESVASLEQSVAIRYPEHPKLNEIGNVVIIGHNYRNGMFFSNLKKVENGDEVKITDENGKKLTYTVYDKYITTAEDFEYSIRDVGENIEVTLVTCTDDGKDRIIVKAKV